MPRIATEPGIEVTQGRTLLAAYIARHGSSGSAVAREVGVPQYTVSRFLTGRVKSLTPQAKQPLRYAEIGMNSDAIQLISDPRIQRALGSAWDGKEQGVVLLASAINALAPVIRDSRLK